MSELQSIIQEIAARADDFLAGTTDRAQARAGIAELLTMDYSFLAPSDRTLVIGAVMSVLENEDFFGIEYVGDPFSEDDPEDSAPF